MLAAAIQNDPLAQVLSQCALSWLRHVAGQADCHTPALPGPCATSALPVACGICPRIPPHAPSGLRLSNFSQQARGCGVHMRARIWGTAQCGEGYRQAKIHGGCFGYRQVILPAGLPEWARCPYGRLELAATEPERVNVL